MLTYETKLKVGTYNIMLTKEAAGPTTIVSGIIAKRIKK